MGQKTRGATTDSVTSRYPLRSLLHYVRLSGFGGVQWQFAAFAEAVRARHVHRQGVVGCCKSMHPLIAKTVAANCERIAFRRHISGLRVPTVLSGLQRARLERLASAIEPDFIVLWDRVEPVADFKAKALERCVYWERGSSWSAPAEQSMRAQAFRIVPFALANSRAAAAVLRQRWDYRGHIAVCPNAVRPQFMPNEQVARTLPTSRPFRLGVAAQLVPLKAVHLALYTLAEVRRAGDDVVLEIAGSGREQAALLALATRLGLARFVTFHGFVRDMASFFGRIDCLIHLSISEAFGSVLVEAMAQGCPVICTDVDGMADVIQQGVGGFKIQGVLTMAENRRLSGSESVLPQWVFNPASEVLEAPRAVSPESAAECVRSLAADHALYTRMSADAVNEVRNRFAFDHHLSKVFGALDEFAYK